MIGNKRGSLKRGIGKILTTRIEHECFALVADARFLLPDRRLDIWSPLTCFTAFGTPLAIE
jgi:hypothetical protein